jgi:hypothetical protein
VQAKAIEGFGIGEEGWTALGLYRDKVEFGVL